MVDQEISQHRAAEGSDERCHHRVSQGRAPLSQNRKCERFWTLPPSAAVEPSKGAFDDPTAWKHHESFRPIGALDDFSFELRQDLRQSFLKVRPLIATIGKELFQERVHPEKGRKKQDAAIAILDIGRMNDGVQQQTQRVYENMALLPLDLFARVIAMRIDAAPLFQRSSRFGYRRWRRSGWLLVRLAPDTPHKARDGCDPACRHSSTSRDSRKVCCAAADLSGSHATGIPFITSHTSTWRLLPPRLAGGINGSTCAHSWSVRSLGYRNLLRS